LCSFVLSAIPGSIESRIEGLEVGSMDSNPIQGVIVKDDPVKTEKIEQFQEIPSEGDHSLYEIVHVGRLNEALKNLRERGYNTILLDLNESDPDGLDNRSKIRTGVEQIPMIGVRGFDEEETTIHALRNDRQVDPSPRYGIEQTIMGTHEYAELIFDAIHEPLVILDTNKIIHLANQSFYHQFHLEPGQTEGRSILDLAAAEWKIPDPLILLGQIMDQGKSPRGFELRHTFPAIGHRVMLLNARSAPSSPGQPDLLLLSFQDITEQTRAQEAVRQANKKLNLLNSITRHDILNQLTVILGYLEILDDSGSSMINSEYISRIEAASTAIKKQIQFTAEYQDIGASPPHWHRLQDVVWRAGGNTRRSGITLKTKLDNLEIYADALLERVFANLFENSLVHGATVTEISISYVPDEDGILLVVEDDGQGVPEALKERIFSMGYGSSTGYGLFLIREILDMTWITIRENGTPGAGARFEMRIPQETYRMPQD
jgi:signal transduction histidine kinase